MILRKQDIKMASEQPVKKKLRRDGEEETTDESDFVQIAENGVRSDLSALHLSLPVNVNEDEVTLNVVNAQLNGINSSVLRTTSCIKSESVSGTGNQQDLCSVLIQQENNHLHVQTSSYFAFSTISTRAIEPSPSIVISQSNSIVMPNISNIQATNHDRNLQNAVPQIMSYDKCISVQSNAGLNIPPQIQCNIRLKSETSTFEEIRSDSQIFPVTYGQNQLFEVKDCELISTGIDDFQNNLVKHCLCGVSESTLRKPFEGQKVSDGNGTRNATLSEWPVPKMLQFLSNLQLLFDVYLKQNNKGYICSRIVDICDAIVRNEHNLVEQVLSLCETKNKFVVFLSAKVLSSFFIIVKANINNEWLETIVNFLTNENANYSKMNFALEIIKRVVEWKDIELHVLEASQVINGAGGSSQDAHMIDTNCTFIQSNDSESFDTTALKGVIIKSLESKWPELILKIQFLVSHNDNLQSETCVLTFLALWESIISVKANLSVIDIKPFYAHLEIFVGLLISSPLSPLIWKQLLSLFNEVLCYGSTLALQDMLPDDTCQLAHLIVRYVKDFRLLDSLPYRRSNGFTVNSFIGTVPSAHALQLATDKTLLQKMVLLVLKSVAVTVKETRSDSSDSSVGSDDYDFYQDMQLIERSIRDVLKRVDVFIKNSLEFHPETLFCKVLVQLFSDQDDYLIEAMVCTLDITIGISYRNAVFPDLISMLDPVHSFIEFLKIVSHDSDVLLDYLVSNETCFLLYLLRYLKYVRRNFAKFVDSCNENGGSRMNQLDNTMTVLIRLKMQINRLVSKELFPYNINPVLRLLGSCENLYDGNEYS